MELVPLLSYIKYLIVKLFYILYAAKPWGFYCLLYTNLSFD